MSAPWVKVCGVTRPGDAELAVALGARFVGLNFYPPSPRCLTPERAAEIAAAVSGRARVVGVFVDPAPREVEAVEERVALDLIQLHGDETPEGVARYGERALKTVRLGPDGVPQGLEEVFPAVWGFLFESRHAAYGGAGRGWDYGRLATLRLGRPWLVAGGIAPGNARRALVESGARGLDVCSGVESEPGVKEPQRLRALFEEVRNVTV